jgi:hypothetical protein
MSDLTLSQRQAISKWYGRHKTIDQISALTKISREKVEECIRAREEGPNDGGVSTKKAKAKVTLAPRA